MTKNAEEPFKITGLSSASTHRGSAYLLREVYVFMSLKLLRENVTIFVFLKSRYFDITK